jgi:hypothetical protein
MSILLTETLKSNDIIKQCKFIILAVSASITMMGLFMQTNMECNAMLLSNDVCELAVKNKTVDWSAEKMMVIKIILL